MLLIDIYINKKISKLNSELISSLRLCLSQFPVNNSIICLMIILIVLDYHNNREELNFKKLYSSLHFFSDVGIKNHLMRLSRTEWVSIKKSKNDSRSKVVMPSKKLLNAYTSIKFRKL